MGGGDFNREAGTGGMEGSVEVGFKEIDEEVMVDQGSFRVGW